MAALLQIQNETVATVAEIRLLQELLTHQRKNQVMDILSTGLFATSVVCALGGSAYLVGSVVATGLIGSGVFIPLGLLVGAGLTFLGRASK
ncbi:hypothetical protein [Nostoc sp.]|uniref:hypothetical protein n=1 Tax=Nostoc sp. TaxID=1180 RepID=UPI002FFD54D6